MDPLPSDGTQIRVLIADDDGAFLESLQGLIDRQPELAVVGAALDGVTAAARLRRDHPNLCLIALTGDDAPALHRAVREAGADEVLLKSELVEGLVERLSAARTRS